MKPFGTPSSRTRFLGLTVVAAYCAVFSWLLIGSSSVPYVFDNNESFSNQLHAKNAFEHGFASTYGLPDEAVSPDSAAHPFAYTHGGNFPRLPVMLFHLLGAREIETQIWLSTFSFGLFGMLLAFWFFARISSPLFAAFACIGLMTDYVMFTQWHANTWRVWHCIFFYASFLCALRTAESPSWKWMALSTLNFWSLFYCELMFGVFVYTSALLYACWERRFALIPTLRSGFAASLGGALAAVTLIGQIVLYLGWDGFVEDLKLTFMARNLAESTAELMTWARSFSAEHHTAFWYSFNDSSHLKSLSGFSVGWYHYILQVYTPLLTSCAQMIFGGWLLSRLAARIERGVGLEDPGAGTSSIRRVAVSWARGRFSSRTNLALVQGSLCLFALCVLIGGGFAALHPAEMHEGLLDRLGALILGALLLWAIVRWQSLVPVSLSASISRCRAMLCATLFGAGSALVIFQILLYAQIHSAFQAELLDSLGGSIPARIAVVSSGLIGAWMVTGRYRANAFFERHVPGASFARFIGSGLLGYVVVFSLTTGALFSGYLKRFAPFSVFLHLPIYALALFLAGGALATQLRLLRLRFAATLRLPTTQDLLQLRPTRRAWLHGVVSVATPLAAVSYLTVYWVKLQAEYVQLLPATHFGVLQELEKQRYQGASVVMNSYPAPVGARTGGWAFQDAGFSRHGVLLSENGYRLDVDKGYLWVANAKDAEYEEPQYWLCVTYQTLEWAARRIEGELRDYIWDCNEDRLVSEAMAGERTKQLVPTPRIAALDPSGEGRWALVALRWDYPAFLAPLDGGANRIQLRVDRAQGRFALSVDYSYRHQDGALEGRSEFLLYDTTQDPCIPEPAEDALVIRGLAGSPLPVPERYRPRTLRAAVRPVTADGRAGPLFWTDSFWLIDGEPKPVRCRGHRRPLLLSWPGHGLELEQAEPPRSLQARMEPSDTQGEPPVR